MDSAETVDPAWDEFCKEWCDAWRADSQPEPEASTEDSERGEP